MNWRWLCSVPNARLASGLHHIAVKMCLIFMCFHVFLTGLRKTSLMAMWRMENIKVPSMVTIVIVQARDGEVIWYSGNGKWEKQKEFSGHSWSRYIKFRRDRRKLSEFFILLLKIILYIGFLIIAASPYTIWPPITSLNSPHVALTLFNCPPTPQCIDILLLEYSRQASHVRAFGLILTFPCRTFLPDITIAWAVISFRY